MPSRDSPIVDSDLHYRTVNSDDPAHRIDVAALKRSSLPLPKPDHPPMRSASAAYREQVEVAPLDPFPGDVDAMDDILNDAFLLLDDFHMVMPAGPLH